MNVVLLVVACVVLFILAVIGWVGRISYGRHNAKLRSENGGLSMKADGLLMVKTDLKFAAHGKSGEPVYIEASRQAARRNAPWIVRITGEGKKDSVRDAGEFPEIRVRLIGGSPTVVLQVGREANAKFDYRYPGLEAYDFFTRR